jgi:integrase
MFPSLGLAPVTKPSFRPPPKRIAWEVLGPAFRGDVETYLEWCAGLDPFAEDARPRKLSPRTLKLRRNQIHAAASALVKSGVPIASIASLSDLLTIDHFRAILRCRNAKAEGKPNNFNCDLAEALVQIAREWVKLDSVQLGKLNMLAGKMPMQRTGLTSKNKRSLAQFDDPKVVGRLLHLPGQLWVEVKREQKPNFRTLAKAQAALAIAMSTYMPVRSKNLHELTFDIHLFLRDGVRATSTMEFGSDEVKNKETELAFDIPSQIGRMLIEYRDRIAPKVIGHRPQRVFVKADGAPKSQAMVAVLISTYLKRRAGIIMTPHQFRHLSAKMILDAQPGAYETVRQLLGQKNLKTTVNFYAGLDSRRAGQHHQKLLDQALASRPSMKSTKAKKPSGGNGAG